MIYRQVRLQEYWGGHGEPKTEVMGDSTRLAAGFVDKQAAIAWCIDEFGPFRVDDYGYLIFE